MPVASSTTRSTTPSSIFLSCSHASPRSARDRKRRRKDTSRPGVPKQNRLRWCRASVGRIDGSPQGAADERGRSWATGQLQCLMASWRERRAWRAEFRQLGADAVQRGIQRSVWHSQPEKLQAARNWLWWQEHRLAVIGLVIAGVGGLVGLGAFFMNVLGQPEAHAFTLYRNSLAFPEMRIHVATFDASDGE